MFFSLFIQQIFEYLLCLHGVILSSRKNNSRKDPVPWEGMAVETDSSWEIREGFSEEEMLELKPCGERKMTWN